MPPVAQEASQAPKKPMRQPSFQLRPLSSKTGLADSGQKGMEPPPLPRLMALRVRVQRVVLREVLMAQRREA